MIRSSVDGRHCVRSEQHGIENLALGVSPKSTLVVGTNKEVEPVSGKYTSVVLKLSSYSEKAADKLRTIWRDHSCLLQIVSVLTFNIAVLIEC